MKLYADLLRDGRAKRGLGDAILLFGLVLLGAGVAVELTMGERTQNAHRLATENLRKRELASEKENDPAQAAAREEAANRMRRDEYRRTFPLNDVLKAIEAIKGGIVREVTVNVETGSGRLELSADSGESLTNAAQTLQDALPDFRVVLRRQAVEGQRIRGTVELQDLRAAEAKWSK